MSRLNRILLATVLLLCSILWLQHRRTIRLTEERDRFRMNSTALLSDVKRMQIDSATMVLDAKALRLTIDEYKEFRAKDAETIERLGVKIRNLEVAARHEVEVKAPIDAAIRDTLIIRDTVPLLRQKVEMVTPYIQLTGLIENKRLKGDIKVPVTLNQAVWVEYKGWWFWKRVKAIHQSISSDNPYVEIRYSRIADLQFQTMQRPSFPTGYAAGTIERIVISVFGYDPAPAGTTSQFIHRKQVRFYLHGKWWSLSCSAISRHIR